jgi:predicted nuclease of restriction endonuclease-like (RecB) superfamily
MKEKRPATRSKPSAGTARGRKTPVTETKESGRAVVLPAQSDLFASVSGLIEETRRTLARQANSTMVFLFWRIGQQVNSEILDHQRAEYGQKIVTTLATQLVAGYGRSFEARNLRRMMQFAEQFPDFGIVSPLATQLSWSHVVEVLALKTPEARLFYLGEAATRQLGKRELRRMIDRKAFERKEIANAQLTEASAIALDTFKDPYLLDVLGLHDGFLEADLEAAVLRELESFILELGGGFTFVARQKRMIIGGEDFHLDLLFFRTPSWWPNTGRCFLSAPCSKGKSIRCWKVHANNWHGAKLCCPAKRKWAKDESSVEKKADLIYGEGVLQTTNVADAAAGKAEVVRKSTAVKSVSVRLRPRAPSLRTIIIRAQMTLFLSNFRREISLCGERHSGVRVRRRHLVFGQHSETPYFCRSASRRAISYSGTKSSDRLASVCTDLGQWQWLWPALYLAA